MQTIESFERRARRGRWLLVAATVLVVGALLATSWTSYWSVTNAWRTVARGQGDRLVRRVHEQMRTLERHPPTAADLQGIIADSDDLGLCYVALLGPRETLLIEAGSAEGGSASVQADLARLGRDTSLTSHGEVVRMIHRPPPDARGRPKPPPGHRVPPPGLGPGPGPGARRHPMPGPGPGARRDPPPGHGPGAPRHLPPGAGPGASRRPPAPGGPPPLIVDFVPTIANQLLADARRTLVLGAAAALALMVTAFVLFRRLLERERSARQREQERRLAGVGEMAAVLAHEIRNPLASLKGHAQLLAESLRADNGGAGAKADRVVGEALRLESLTTALLDYVRAGRIERAVTDPVDLLRGVVAEVAPGRCNVNVADAPASWPLDPVRIRQVLMNLLDNAMQASPEGAAIDASVSTENGELVFEVGDRGAGIARGEERRIFEPFYTTRARGTGLGLAVVARMVDLHGGSVEARARHDGGATFRVSIPGDGA